MTTWNNENTFMFLELYQGEPTIWDPKNKYHKDKPKVNDAWFRLSIKMEMAVAELKKKKESLMACFRIHLKKKKASIQSGTGEEDVYKPIWSFYEVMEAFLGVIYECTPTISTDDNGQKRQVEVNENFESDSAITSISVGSTPTPQGLSTPLTPTPQRPSSSKLDVRGQRRRASNPELQEAGKQINEAFSTLSNVLNKRTNEMFENKEDECDLYGKLLSKKLRKLPEDEREEAMYMIDGILLQKTRRRNINNLWNAYPQSKSPISPNQSIISSPRQSPFSEPPPMQNPNPLVTTVSARAFNEGTPHIFTNQAHDHHQSTSKIIVSSNEIIVPQNKNLVDYVYYKVSQDEGNGTDQRY